MTTTPYPVPDIAEEPLGSVARILSLGAGDGTDVFTGGSLPQLSGRVYGGQVVAQGLLAAAATVPDDGDGERLPHSVHAYFMRGGRLEEPISFQVERLHDGRSFSQRRTTARQDGIAILAMISSFQEEQGGAEVQIEAPQVPSHEDLPSALEIFRTIDHPVAKFLGRTAALTSSTSRATSTCAPPRSPPPPSTCGCAPAGTCRPRPPRRCTGLC